MANLPYLGTHVTLLCPICEAHPGVISCVYSSDNDFVELKVLPRRLKMEPSLARFSRG